MNYFKLIKATLDKIYFSIPGTEARKDAAITNALQELSAHYRNLKVKGPLDYSDPIRRFAYLYCYTACHSDFIYSVFHDCSDACKRLRQDKLLITAIGGGPGSDLLGILKLVEEKQLTKDLSFFLLDRISEWGGSWMRINQVASTKTPFQVFFQTFDVTLPSSYTAYPDHFDSDLFTLSYFMSEIWALKAQATPYFDTLFKSAKSGALFFFVDNWDEENDWPNWFDGYVKQFNCKVLYSYQEKRRLMSFSEQTKDLAPYTQKFRSPKLTGRIAARIVIKP